MFFFVNFIIIFQKVFQNYAESQKKQVVEETNNFDLNELQKDQSDVIENNESDCSISYESNNEDILHINLLLHSENQENCEKKSSKFSCKLCSFKTERESHYIKHVALHDPSVGSIVYNCDECSFSTLRFTHLRRHQVIHSSTALTCSSCTYSTDDVKLLARHKRMKHKVSKYLFMYNYVYLWTFLGHS